MKLQMLGLSVNDLLSREQMKKVIGGSGGSGGGSGSQTCTSTCYKGTDPDGGKHELGSCTTEDCQTHAGDCKQSYPTATSSACSCS